jgi:hypothetical protein
MFRVNRLYDRGDNDYSTKTPNGLTMTRIREHQWEDQDGGFADENKESFLSQLVVQLANMKPGDWKLDGKDFTFPTWQKLYK